VSEARGIERWKRRARQFKLETYALYLAYKDPRVPWYAKVFAACVVGYALSPIDLIPDFIPVLGPCLGSSWCYSCIEDDTQASVGPVQRKSTTEPGPREAEKLGSSQCHHCYLASFNSIGDSYRSAGHN